MFKFATFALVALAAISMVTGAAIFPRLNTPSSWDSDVFEHYEDYRTRCLAIGCQNQQNTQFFDDCCQPLKKGETFEDNRPPYCSSGANPSSSLSGPPSNTLVSEPSSSPSPDPTSVSDSGNFFEDEYDDDEEDCDHHYPSSSTPPSVSTPSNDPEPMPTPTPTPEPSPSSSTDDAAPSPTPDQNTPSGSETHTGADLTWFTQNGVAGACGTVHSDDDFIAALDSRTYGGTGSQSQYCGKKIRISWQGKSVDVTVADACPTCSNPSSVDLSVAAFKALASTDVGLLTGATWTLL